MPKRILLLLFILLLFSLGLLVVSAKNWMIFKPSRVCFNDHCFEVEIADTLETRAQGLMFKECLGPDSGMLFIFDREDHYSFWMKNMLFPLDIIWMNKDKEAVFIEKNVMPCKKDCFAIFPDKEAMYVLELNAGTADKINLRKGDDLIFYDVF